MTEWPIRSACSILAIEWTGAAKIGQDGNTKPRQRIELLVEQ
jgi:hypothetical protein